MTGATGFVGRTLCRELAQQGWIVRGAVRDPNRMVPEAENVVIGDIASFPDWRRALRGVDVVVHTAARVHETDHAPTDLKDYIAINTDSASRLATAAANFGVHRFVYLSSVKVNGEVTNENAFTPTDPPRPIGAYAESKLLGEMAVLQAGAQSNMEVAIVRCPLVYGPQVRANFLRLMKWVDQERVLPIAGVHNKRSLVNIWNLCSLIVRLSNGQIPAGRVWMVSDGHDVSTPDLVYRLARFLGRRARLVHVPLALLYVGGALTGQLGSVRRLCSSLTVDVAATHSELGWRPEVTLDSALERTARWYAEEIRAHGS